MQAKVGKNLVSDSTREDAPLDSPASTTTDAPYLNVGSSVMVLTFVV